MMWATTWGGGEEITTAAYTIRWLASDETELSSETREGTVGTSVMVNPEDLLAMEGYTFRNEDERNVQTEVLAADGSTELKLYFDENEISDTTVVDETVSDVIDDDKIDVTDVVKAPETTEENDMLIEESAEKNDMKIDASESLEETDSEVMYTVEWRNGFNQLIQSETRVAKAGSEVSVTEEDKAFDKTGRYFFNEEADNVLHGAAAKDLVLVLFFDDVNAVMPIYGPHEFHFVVDMTPYGGKKTDKVYYDIAPPLVSIGNSALPGEMSLYDKFDWSYIDANFNYTFGSYTCSLSSGDDGQGNWTTPYWGTFWGEKVTDQKNCKWYFGSSKKTGSCIYWNATPDPKSVSPKSGVRVDAVFTGDVNKTFTRMTVLAPNTTVELSTISPDVSQLINDSRYTVTFDGYSLISGNGSLSDGTFTSDGDYSVVQANYSILSRCSLTVVYRELRDGEVVYSRPGSKHAINPDLNQSYDLTKYYTKGNKDSLQFDSYKFASESDTADLTNPKYVQCMLTNPIGDIVIYADWVESVSDVVTVEIEYQYTGDVEDTQYKTYKVPRNKMFTVSTLSYSECDWYDRTDTKVCVLDMQVVEGDVQIADDRLGNISTSLIFRPVSNLIRVKVKNAVYKMMDDERAIIYNVTYRLPNRSRSIGHGEISGKAGDIISVNDLLSNAESLLASVGPSASLYGLISSDWQFSQGDVLGSRMLYPNAITDDSCMKIPINTTSKINSIDIIYDGSGAYPAHISMESRVKNTTKTLTENDFVTPNTNIILSDYLVVPTDYVYNYTFSHYTIDRGNCDIVDSTNVDSILNINKGTNTNDITIIAWYTRTPRVNSILNFNITGDDQKSNYWRLGTNKLDEVIDLDHQRKSFESRLFNTEQYAYHFTGYTVDEASTASVTIDTINDTNYVTLKEGKTSITANYIATKFSDIRVDLNVTGDIEFYENGETISKFDTAIQDRIQIKDYFSFDDRTNLNVIFDGYRIKAGNGQLVDASNEHTSYVFTESGDSVHIVANFTVKCKSDQYYLIYDTESGFEYGSLTPKIPLDVSTDGVFNVTNEIPDRGSKTTFECWVDSEGDEYHAGDSYISDKKISYLTARYKISNDRNQLYYKLGSRLIFDGDITKYVLNDNWVGGLLPLKHLNSFFESSSTIILKDQMPMYDPQIFSEYLPLYHLEPSEIRLHSYYLGIADTRRMAIRSIKDGEISVLRAASDASNSTFTLDKPVYSFYVTSKCGSSDGNESLDTLIQATFVQDYNAIPFANYVDIVTKVSGDVDVLNTKTDIIMPLDDSTVLAPYIELDKSESYEYRFLGYSVINGDGVLAGADNQIAATFRPTTKPYEGKIKIQALFSATKKPSLSYDTNGGSEIEPTCAENDQFMVTRKTPVKDGFIFKGWAKKADATDIDYIAGDLLSGKEDRVLYAVWAEDDGSGSTNPGGPSIPTTKTYTLSYDTKTDQEIADQKSNTGSFTVTRRIPVKAGHFFAGWSLDTNPTSAAEVDYFAGDVFPATSDVTLYAVFVPNSELATYSVTYDTQGGSEVKPTTPIDGQFMVTRQVPMKKGYTFAGWALESDSKGIDYIGGDRIAAIEDVTLYAIWVKDTVAAKYTLSYDTQGGSEVLDTEAIDGKFMVTRRTPKKDGKVFLGWSLYPNDTDIDYLAGDMVLADKNVTLYAVYTDAADAPVTKTYTITYNTNGGSAVAETKSYNGIFTVTRRMPEKEGLTFVGWTRTPDSENANDVDYVGGDSFPAEEDLTLYALYVTAMPPIHVNGGSEVETTVTVENNQYIIVITIPTKPGYTFPGWDTDGDGTPDVEPGDPIVTDDLDTPIDAVWTLKVTPAQYVTTNDSTWLSNVLWDSMDTVDSDHVRGVDDALIDSDGRAMVQIPDSVPVRTGYVFVGWELSNPMLRVMARSNAYYQAGDAVYMDEIDSAYENGLRFTAIWEPEDSDDGNTPGTGDKPGTDDGNTPGTGDKPGTDDGNTPGTGDKPGTDDGNTPGTGDKPGTDDGNTPGIGDKPDTDDGNTPGIGDKPGTDDGNTPGTGDKPGTDDGNTPGIGDKPTLTKPGHTQPTLNLNYGKPNRTSGMVYRNSRTGIAPKTGDATDTAKTTTAALALLGSLVVLSVTLERKKRSIQ